MHCTFGPAEWHTEGSFKPLIYRARLMICSLDASCRDGVVAIQKQRKSPAHSPILIQQNMSKESLMQRANEERL